jgi:heme exporter protein D
VTFAAVAWSAAALTVASAVLVCVLVLRRAAVARADERRRQAEERLRPFVLALVSGEEPPTPVVTDEDASVVALMLARYARQLAGSAHGHVATFFERHGYLDRELSHLRNRRAWKRAGAAYALGDMGSQRAIEPLLAALADDSRAVRAAAARSLGRLGAVAAVEPLVEALVRKRVPRAVAGQALLTIGPASLPHLRGLARHPEADMRAVVIELIGLLGHASDASLVSERLRDSAAEVRAKATRALGRLGAAEAAADLRAALDDRIPYVRATAAIALGMIGDRAAAPRLLVQAREDQFDPAQAAARALARVDTPLLWDAARRLGQGPHVAEAADLTAVRRLPAL